MEARASSPVQRSAIFDSAMHSGSYVDMTSTLDFA